MLPDNKGYRENLIDVGGAVNGSSTSRRIVDLSWPARTAQRYRRRAVRASSRSWPTQTGCRCAGLPSRYDLRFAGLRLVRRRQGVGWLVGGSPAGEEPE